VGVYDDQGNANDGYNCARILLSRHSNETFEIALFNPIYFPSGYPLLFARGGFGWHPDLKRTTGDKLTLLDYCRYLVQIRASAPNIPLATLFGLVFLVQDVVAGWSISLSLSFSLTGKREFTAPNRETKNAATHCGLGHSKGKEPPEFHSV